MGVPKKTTGFFWVRTRVSEPCLVLSDSQLKVIFSSCAYLFLQKITSIDIDNFLGGVRHGPINSQLDGGIRIPGFFNVGFFCRSLFTFAIPAVSQE